MSRRLTTVFLTVSLLVPVVATDEGAASATAPATPEVGAIEGALPPGARQLLGALRIVNALGARNRVYREARSVQGDLRSYYDAQIETAQRQLAEREQLGLHDSQVRAYVRVVEKLRAERDAALAITEDEKRAAKFGFESKLKRELTTALLQIPRVRAGLEKAKQAIDDLKGAFEQARAALEGGNPITDFVGDLRDKLDKVDQFAEIGSLINGRFGRSLGDLSAKVRGELDKVEQGVDQAIGAADSALAELDGVTAGIDESLESTRTVRADLAVEQVIESTLDRILTPRGAQPERDVLADALARNQLTAEQRAVGVAAGAIDPADFRRMRDRVHAAMLGRSLERIGEICGRLVGAARRLQLDAAAAGNPPPDTSTPCTLFGNPEDLQALIDAHAATPSTVATTTSQGDGETAEPVGDGEIEITELEYPVADLVFGGETAYSEGRIVFSVSGETVHATYTAFFHHAWVTGPTGEVTCWADSNITLQGSGALGRTMTIDMVPTAQTPAELYGSSCEEFPYDDTILDQDPIPVTMFVDDDGTVNGYVDIEGTRYLEFG